MNKGGTHLTYEKRLLIEELSKNGVKVAEIAAWIGCTRPTIYREYKRGGAFQEYSARRAQEAVGSGLDK